MEILAESKPFQNEFKLTSQGFVPFLCIDYEQVMTNTSIQHQLERLKLQIEAQLQWGGSEAWNNYDFEKLSDAIVEKTGVSLSVSTLKRIFGKVPYTSKPSLSTLNALAQFVLYKDWRDFLANNAAAESDAVIEEKDKTPIVETKRRNYRVAGISVLAVLLLGVFGFLALSKKPKYNPDDFTFISKTMLTEGLPNSVLFDFDASNADAGDSVFICQTWDIRRKVLVDKDGKHHSAIYYYPGFFRAKLMIGGNIILEHDIQIKTDGWLGLVEADWGVEPLYFKQTEILKPDGAAVDKDLLNKYHLALGPSPLPVRLYNQKDIRGIFTDNFTFETELKSDYMEGANTCQRIEVLLHAKNDILIVPIVQKACVGDIAVIAYGHYAKSDMADLSGFGCNPIEWTKLRIVCKNGTVNFFINDIPIYSTQILNKATEIVGVQYRFNGMGEVRNTWLEGASGRVGF